MTSVFNLVIVVLFLAMCLGAVVSWGYILKLAIKHEFVAAFSLGVACTFAAIGIGIEWLF